MDIEPFALVTEKMEVYVNLRLELRGPDEKVNGYDIKLSGQFANHAILPKLDVELLPALYTDDKQHELDEFKKKLRFPRAMKKALQWDMEVPRVVLTVHDEHEAADSLIINDCTAHKFTFLPKELGIVDLEFTVKTKEMTEGQVMKLLHANGQTLKISLECKPAEEKPDNYQQVYLLGKDPGAMSEARKQAEAQFTGGAPAADKLPALEASAPPPAEAPAKPPKADKPAKPAKAAAAPAAGTPPVEQQQEKRPRRTAAAITVPE